MIIVKLQGGLGNQMFQYAFGLAAQKQFKQRLYFDDIFYLIHNRSTQSFTARPLELKLFDNISYNEIPWFVKIILRSDCKIVVTMKNNNKFLCDLRQIENELIGIKRYNPRFINVCEGYFQSQEYFKEFANELKSCFEFPELDGRNKNYALKILQGNSVSIHVRRGDYITSESSKRYHGVLPIEYYSAAIKVIESKIENPRYFIFSDDMNWVKNNLPISGDHIYFVEGNTSVNSWKDMALMSLAKHHVLANSSFSWWGAWLAGDTGIKIAPKNWFNPEVAKFNIEDIIPEKWIKI